MGKNNKNDKNSGQANQRMAGDVWKTYDASTQGGAGFSNADIKYLQSQNWSNNDIMRAAANSGDVRGGADQRLRKLSTQTMDARKLPEEVRDKMGDKYGMMAPIYLRDAQFSFLGGDKNDYRNYKIQEASGINGNKNEGLDNGFDSIFPAGLVQRHNSKNGEVLTWQGINADGSAHALLGNTVKKKGDKEWEFDSKQTTWRLPAAKPAEAEPETPAPEQPKPDPVASFDPGQYTTRLGRQEPAKPFALDTNTSLYDNWLQRGSSSSSGDSTDATAGSGGDRWKLFSQMVDQGVGSPGTATQRVRNGGDRHSGG